MKKTLSLSDIWPKLLLGLAALGVIAMVLDKTTSVFSGEGPAATTINVIVPERLSAMARDGQNLFNESCAACHGKNAAGTDQGPPLVHDIYNPGHHADIAFQRAARFGVRAHHWRFGNMPKQEHVTDAEVAAIIVYVRELQAANGIVSRPHTM